MAQLLINAPFWRFWHSFVGWVKPGQLPDSPLPKGDNGFSFNGGISASLLHCGGKEV
jgi:hypothetical protein